MSIFMRMLWSFVLAALLGLVLHYLFGQSVLPTVAIAASAALFGALVGGFFGGRGAAMVALIIGVIIVLLTHAAGERSFTQGIIAVGWALLAGLLMQVIVWMTEKWGSKAPDEIHIT